MFLLAFSALSTDSISLGESAGNLNKNSTYLIMQMMLTLSIIGVFITTAFMANSIIRDHDLNTHSLFYSKPISKFGYLMGRFSASIIICFLIYWGAAIGCILAFLMSGQDIARIGSFDINTYLFSLFVLVLPNVFILGAISFSLATLTRKILYTYIGILVLFVGFSISQTLTADMEFESIGAILDPFGIRAYIIMTKYWTIVEKNTLLLPVEGLLMQNRVLWMIIGSSLLTLTYFRFQFAEGISRRGKKQEDEKKLLDHDLGFVDWSMPAVIQNFSTVLQFRQFLTQVKMEIIGIIKSVPFIIIMALGLFSIFFNASGNIEMSMYGESRYPVTYLIINAIEGAFNIFVFIIITFYSGELVWRERSVKINEIFDSLPIPEWIPFTSKLFSLIFVTILLLLSAVAAGICIQMYQGYFNFDLWQYFVSLFMYHFFSFILFCVAAMFIQTVVNKKFIGFMFMALLFIINEALPGLGYEHNLYMFKGESFLRYSDMNGFGPIAVSVFWFSLYRTLLAVLLCMIAILFWISGTETRLRLRLKLAILRFKSRQIRRITAFTSIAFLATGSFVFYNTNIINNYETSDDSETRAVYYEKIYKRYSGIPQPKIKSVNTNVDIYPYKRDFNVRGSYVLVNKALSPIDSIHVFLNDEMKINSLSISESRQVHKDEIGYYIYDLNEPLLPGDSVVMSFDLSYNTRGFVNSNPNTDIVNNGTFISNLRYFPHIGYMKNLELSNRNTRKKHGLPPPERAPSIYDSLAWKNTTITESDWINFETIVSTSENQNAISPGYLQKEWVENGRRYFHYKMDIPILNFFSFQSAEYKVKRDKWNDINIEIYYHETHNYNIDRMINSIKKGLDYYTKNFSPYQYNQVRILEFPRYASFAQSFPNTIPYSESGGFIAKYKDENDIDMVFFITAHELAHQWWAHQVIGAGVQGSTVMSESLAQYSALMVMEKEYGLQNVQRFLKYELDNYLSGRSFELLKELPLYLNENQGYIHYSKGSLVMYALQDYIGEDKLNNALAKYIKDVAFQDPPYTTSLEFLEYIREATPDSLEYIIEDMFETITLYDNRAVSAVYSKTSDGRYLVDLTIITKKLRADSLGNETEIPINDWIYIAVLGEENVNGKTVEKKLYMEKHKLNKPQMNFRITVDELPLKAGIDPYSLLIDRIWDDNLVKVEEKKSGY
jgi:ABC-type transport system involved in multi-copper enzyme maturation permease subunit